MANAEVNLSNCDKELIHIPGKIQSHGFLIVVDTDNIIRFYSNNIFKYIPDIEPQLAGQPLQNIESKIGIRQQGISRKLLHNKAASFEEVNPMKVAVGGRPFNLIISASDNYYLLEFEPALEDVLPIQKMIARFISLLLAEKKMQGLLHNAAEQVKSITGFDRVMIYRFAADGHGEVVAEAKNDRLESWMGLHYPASDIPRQARDLYKLNLTRLIADVHSVPSEIAAEASNAQPLNLTHSQLRAVSPIHIQYLKNMGVASSFSISLLQKKELWGLIACHNYSPAFIDYRARQSSNLIGQIVSSALEFRLHEEDQEQREHFKTHLFNLSHYLHEYKSIADALVSGDSTILDLTHASGAVLVYDQKFSFIGVTPNESQLADLLHWVKENTTKTVYATTGLPAFYPPALHYKEVASGMLLVVLSREPGEYVIWFKPEVLQSISWAGNPDKPALTSADGSMNLSPRLSFETWSQSVSGTSDTWSKEEEDTVKALQQEILRAVNVKAGAIGMINESLRKAYDELDTFSFTISHDLKGPLTAVKSYAQVLSLDADISEASKVIVRRIILKADQMDQMMNAILHYSHLAKAEIPTKKIPVTELIYDIIRDLDHLHDPSKLQIFVTELPGLRGDPVLIRQVFSNLITNAVKYSKQSQPAVIEISGSENNTETQYSIKDNGTGIPQQNLRQVFGLFKRLENTEGIDGSGVGLAIVKRIVEKHNGKVWVESEPGTGSTFHILFNKNVPV